MSNGDFDGVPTGIDRRTLVKKMAVGAFVVPAIASFKLDSLAHAGTLPGSSYPNQTYPNQTYPNQTYPNQTCDPPGHSFPNQSFPGPTLPREGFLRSLIQFILRGLGH